MPRTEACLAGGVRIADLMSVMLLASVFPLARVKQILTDTGRTSVRERDLPASLMMYYVMALGLYMQENYEEVLRCVFEAYNWMVAAPARVRIASRSAIFRARDRLGDLPVKEMYRQMVGPFATESTRGAWYRGWRVVSLDGSTLDVADTEGNGREFGRPGVSRGSGSAYPKLRFCTLVENGTHCMFGATPGPYKTGETTLAREVVEHLGPGMLCLADRNFYSFQLWVRATLKGSDLLWRVKRNLVLEREQGLSDGSFLATIYPSVSDRRHRQNGITVRVVAYHVRTDATDDEGAYILLTTILDPAVAPAAELADLYAQRWEIETTLDEFKTHLRGRGIVLRSKTPAGVYQEFWGLLLAHHAIRSVMHDAALAHDIDPDRLSFTRAASAVRRKLPLFVVTPPSEVETLV